MYTNYRATFPKNMRPVKKQVFLYDFKEMGHVPNMNKIKLTTDGMIILTFRIDEIIVTKGNFLPN